MEEDYIEVIGVEQLKTILTDLSPKDIVTPAYEKWIPCQRTGYTILDLENGKIYPLGVEQNQLPLVDKVYIELYTIDALENPIKPKEIFSSEEYEEYLTFKGDDPSEYTPDLVQAFCENKGIDEDERCIDVLADRFEENEYFNYNRWESGILNEYYDAIQEEHSTFKTVDEEV